MAVIGIRGRTIAERVEDLARNLHPAVAAHIIDIMAYGQLTIGDFKPPDQFPPMTLLWKQLLR
jgi:hypothetical protein